MADEEDKPKDTCHRKFNTWVNSLFLIASIILLVWYIVDNGIHTSYDIFVSSYYTLGVVLGVYLIFIMG